MSCDFCQKKKDLPIVCDVCKLIKYCSIECQKKDHDDHRVRCMRFDVTSPGTSDEVKRKDIDEFFKEEISRFKIAVPDTKPFFITVHAKNIGDIKKSKDKYSKDDQEYYMNDAIFNIKDEMKYKDLTKKKLDRLTHYGMILFALDYPNITFEKK